MQVLEKRLGWSILLWDRLVIPFLQCDIDGINETFLSRGLVDRPTEQVLTAD